MTHPHIFICIVFTGRDLRYQAGIFPRSEIRASDNLNVCYTQTFQHRTTGADCSYITVIPPYLRVNKAQVQPNTVTLRYCSISEVLAHRLPAFAFGMLITVAAPPPLCLLSKCLSSMITACEDDYPADVQLTPTNWLISFIAI